MQSCPSRKVSGSISTLTNCAVFPTLSRHRSTSDSSVPSATTKSALSTTCALEGRASVDPKCSGLSADTIPRPAYVVKLAAFQRRMTLSAKSIERAPPPPNTKRGRFARRSSDASSLSCRSCGRPRGIGDAAAWIEALAGASSNLIGTVKCLGLGRAEWNSVNARSINA